MQRACKSAIKGGDVLNNAQIGALLKSFKDSENKPLQCPHGRPTVIKFSKPTLKNGLRGSYEKLLFIVGPTASGKSDFAVQVAKMLKTDVISSDSMQIYKDMTVGTAKSHPRNNKASRIISLIL